MALKRKRTTSCDRDRDTRTAHDDDETRHLERNTPKRARRDSSSAISPAPSDWCSEASAPATSSSPPPSRPPSSNSDVKEKRTESNNETIRTVRSNALPPLLEGLVSRRTPHIPAEIAVTPAMQLDLAAVNEKLELYLSVRDMRQNWRVSMYGKQVAEEYLPGLTPVHVREEYQEEQRRLEAEFWAETSADEEEDDQPSKKAGDTCDWSVGAMAQAAVESKVGTAVHMARTRSRRRANSLPVSTFGHRTDAESPPSSQSSGSYVEQDPGQRKRGYHKASEDVDSGYSEGG